MKLTTDPKSQNETAKKILFDTYWSNTGWRSEPHTPTEDFELACNAGYMFKPEEFDHDKVVSRVKEARSRCKLLSVSNAFLASLSSRRLELRSALGSFAVLSEFPEHAAPGEKKETCEICGYSLVSEKEDLSVLNFERLKWGGVRHSDALYAAFDLTLFAQLEPVLPTSDDLRIMHEIVEILQSAAPDDTPRQLEQKLNKTFASNKEERDVLLTILAYCGVLQPEGRTGYFQVFTNRAFSDHIDNLPKAYKLDWRYPLCWWRGKDGVNKRALRHYFPQL